MTPEQMRKTLSRYLDGDLSAAATANIEQVLASSDEARRYFDQLVSIRDQMRQETAGEIPDLAPSILAIIGEPPRESRRPARRVTLAAGFAAGLVAGAVFIGFAFRQPIPVAAADIPDEVIAAQSRVGALTARIDIVERGWHPDVPERRFEGNIQYLAPESLWIEISDITSYPSSAWIPNHTTVVVDEDTAWSSGLASCPTESLPDCMPTQPRAMVILDREPFPDASPAPLDLIVPVNGFNRAGEPALLGVTEVDGKRAVGVSITAAQVAALLDGLTTAGNWRDIHPTDRVELWLDEQHLVPLALSVFPAETSDRALWAIRHGYDDRAEVPILEVAWSEVVFGTEPIAFPSPPQGGAQGSAGFTDASEPEPSAPVPLALPDGMTLHRAGAIDNAAGPEVSIASWSDGRAWVKVRSTSSWEGSHLFGDVGALVREVQLGSGVAYLSEGGDRIGIHGEDIDLVVLGSLPTEALLEIAGSIGVDGRPVPSTWVEAAASTLDDARAEVAGLLVPMELEGFGPPAIRAARGVATMSYAGPGDRAFLLTQAADTELSPPLEANVRGVTVRGVDGRYSPDRGLLEWVEGELGVALASTTLSVDELVSIAESLESP
jgi:hypothetical protein